MYDDLHFLPFSLNQEYLGDDDSYYNNVSYKGTEFSKKQTEELDKNFKRDKTIYSTRNIKDFVAKQWLLTREL